MREKKFAARLYTKAAGARQMKAAKAGKGPLGGSWPHRSLAQTAAGGDSKEKDA
jgi:hypothetical protein